MLVNQISPTQQNKRQPNKFQYGHTKIYNTLVIFHFAFQSTESFVVRNGLLLTRIKKGPRQDM